MTNQAFGRWLSVAAVMCLLLLSVAVRARNLASPLTEDHSFRQTQTAITVWTFASEGIRPLAYETPVFGPPWRLPLEFPTFQIAAALLVKAGLDNLDVACRLTNIAFFYLSAAFLYALCRQLLTSSAAAICILLTYVWFPFTIFWSRTAMIDFASVAFTLAYLYGCARWLASGRAANALLSIIAGSLAALTKPTTVPIIAATLVWLAWRQRRKWRAFIAGGVPILLIPMALAAAWSVYTDGVRRASPATEWLTAGVLNAWSIGSWAQRLEAHNWLLILDRVQSTFLPMGLVLLLAIGLWRTVRTDIGADRGFVLTMLVSAVATVVVFFNLYREHSYYLMAVAPALAISAGFGLHWLMTIMPNRAASWAVGLALLGFCQWNARSYLAPPFSSSYETDFTYRVGRAIAEVTAPDERVIVEGHDWIPDYLYYAQRKGLMWGGIVEVAPEPRARLLASDHFTTIVALPSGSEAMQFWPHHELARRVGPLMIYKVSK